MSLTVDDLKNQLRIDGTQDDTYIQELLSEAQDYIIGAVDSSQPLANYEAHPIFDRAVALLVGHWYFNRQQTYTASRMLPLSIPYGVNEIIVQLTGAMVVTTLPTTDTDTGGGF